jgi:hypothetical protein
LIEPCLMKVPPVEERGRDARKTLVARGTHHRAASACDVIRRKQKGGSGNS